MHTCTPQKRNLYPNVDFYSGIVLRALGIPVSMYTVLFAVARTVGWVAQWKEMVAGAESKITRPRQMYMGKMERAFVSVARRQGADDGSEEDELMLEDTRYYSSNFKREVTVKNMRVA